MFEYAKDTKINSVHIGCAVQNQRQLMEVIANMAAKQTGLSGNYILKNLIEAEERRSSSVGRGIAIPTIKCEKLLHPLTFLIRLDTPVDMMAHDSQPVDIICLLISPEREGSVHLRRTSRLARLLKNKNLQGAIRQAASEDEIKAVLMNTQDMLMAA